MDIPLIAVGNGLVIHALLLSIMLTNFLFFLSLLGTDVAGLLERPKVSFKVGTGLRPRSFSLVGAPLNGFDNFDDEEEDDESDYDKTLLRGSAVLHKTPLMLQLEEVEKGMKKNYRAAREMIDIVEKDVDFQKVMRKQTSIAVERLKIVKADMIRQLNQARSHYEEDMDSVLKEHAKEIEAKDREIAAKNAIIAAYENDRSSIRQSALNLLLLLARNVKTLFEFRKSRRRERDEAASASKHSEARRPSLAVDAVSAQQQL